MTEELKFVATFDVAVIGDIVGLDVGPLPLSAEVQTPNALLSNRFSRSRYAANQRVTQVLWGDGTFNPRYHRFRQLPVRLTTERGTSIVGELSAFEVLYWDSGARAMVCVHGSIASGPEALSALIEMADIDPTHGNVTRRLYQQYIGSVLSINQSRRRARMSYFVATNYIGLRPHPNLAASADAQWAWYLATCQLPSRIAPPAELEDIVSSAAIPVAHEWRVVVMRDAYVNLATSIDILSQTGAQEAERRRIRLLTIELDALLLVELQDLMAELVETRIYKLGADDSRSRSVVEGDSVLRAYRSMYWGSRLLERGPGQLVFEALRVNRELPRRMNDLAAAVTSLENDVQRSISNQTNAALGLIAAVGLPASIAFAVWSATQPDDLRSTVWPVVGTALGCILVLIMFPGIRMLVRDAIARRGKL